MLSPNNCLIANYIDEQQEQRIQRSSSRELTSNFRMMLLKLFKAFADLIFVGRFYSYKRANYQSERPSDGDILLEEYFDALKKLKTFPCFYQVTQEFKWIGVWDNKKRCGIIVIIL